MKKRRRRPDTLALLRAARGALGVLELSLKDPDTTNRAAARRAYTALLAAVMDFDNGGEMA